MICAKVFTFCLAFVFASNFVKCSDDAENAIVKVVTVENLAEYLKENPDVQILEKLTEETFTDGVSPKLQKRFVRGNRVTGDFLVEQNSAGHQWSTSQDVTLTINYPRNGIGAIVTFVEVEVDQESGLGDGFITSGGIGQRHITILITARETRYFQYTSRIYGR